ncbi:MAG: hypothetical protein QM778_31165 [Myxococcales bacterium]
MSEAEGVRGVALFDGAGRCVTNNLPAPYEAILLTEVTRRLASSFDIFGSLNDGRVDGFFANCEGGGILLRRLDSYTVLALTTPDVNITMLHVALNVLALNLARAEPSSVLASGKAPEVSRSLTQGADLTSRSSGAYGEQVPPDAVGKALVVQMLGVYVNYTGPAAKVLFKQQLAALGVTARTLRHGQFNDFLTRLAAKIPNPERQQSFIEAARALRQPLRV